MEKLTFDPRARNYYSCVQTKDKMTRKEIEGYRRAYRASGINSARVYLENKKDHGKEKSKKLKHNSGYRGKYK